jgi:hypothetical protein
MMYHRYCEEINLGVIFVTEGEWLVNDKESECADIGTNDSEWGRLPKYTHNRENNKKFILKGECPMKCVENLQLSEVEWYSEKSSNTIFPNYLHLWKWEIHNYERMNNYNSVVDFWLYAKKKKKKKKEKKFLLTDFFHTTVFPTNIIIWQISHKL